MLGFAFEVVLDKTVGYTDAIDQPPLLKQLKAKEDSISDTLKYFHHAYPYHISIGSIMEDFNLIYYFYNKERGLRTWYAIFFRLRFTNPYPL